MFTFKGLSVFVVLSLMMTDLVAEPIETKVFESSEKPTALLELYTSQGCSSCPPAERWFSNLVHDKRLWIELFPVAFHVDYWDYIGWVDPFADPKFGSRQRLYAHLGYTRNVATPGFIYDGKGWNGWFRGQRLPVSAEKHSLGKLKATIKGKRLKIDYLSSTGQDVKSLPGQGSVKLNVAVLGFDMMVDINAGENDGRRLRQDFVVLSHQSLFMNENQDSWSLSASLPEHSFSVNKQAIVIWVSQGRDPTPLQVTGGWL